MSVCCEKRGNSRGGCVYLQSSHGFLRMEMELERAGIHLYHNYPRGSLIYVVNINNETVVKFEIHTFLVLWCYDFKLVAFLQC